MPKDALVLPLQMDTVVAEHDFSTSIIQLRHEAPQSRKIVELFTKQLTSLVSKLERHIATRLKSNPYAKPVRAYGLFIAVFLDGSEIPEFAVLCKTAVKLKKNERESFAEVAYGKKHYRAVLPRSSPFSIAVGVAGPESKIGIMENLEYIKFADSIALMIAGLFSLKTLEECLRTADSLQLVDIGDLLKSATWKKREVFEFMHQRKLFP